jgi:hypothetical protein
MESIDENICQRYVGEKPKDVVPCFGNCNGTGWVHGEWDQVEIVFNLSSLSKYSH